MHMSDALVSTPVAVTAAAVAGGLIVAASRRVRNSARPDIVPLMGVMGAFIFAAQMINFTIPGTGSSGHVVGGVLLAAVLGPWAAFLTLTSVIIVQCLVFADGGLMALGCNILNMAAASTLIAYPLVYKPLAGKSLGTGRLVAASAAACVVALEIGALGVTAETELSGITAINTIVFLEFMLPIHFVIGLFEGLATAAVIVFLARYRSDTLVSFAGDTRMRQRHGLRGVVVIVGAVTLVLAGCFFWIASEKPDGLEWSLQKVAGWAEFPSATLPTAIMPDYDQSFAGIVGAVLVMLLLWGFSSLIIGRMNRSGHREKRHV